MAASIPARIRGTKTRRTLVIATNNLSSGRRFFRGGRTISLANRKALEAAPREWVAWLSDALTGARRAISGAWRCVGRPWEALPAAFPRVRTASARVPAPFGRVATTLERVETPWEDVPTPQQVVPMALQHVRTPWEDVETPQRVVPRAGAGLETGERRPRFSAGGGRRGRGGPRCWSSRASPGRRR